MISKNLALFIDRLDNQPGGAERFTEAIAHEFRARGWDVLVVTSRGMSREVALRFSEVGIAHKDLGRQSRFDYWRLIQLVPLLRGNRISVLHTHKFGSNLVGVVLGRIAGVSRILAHEHTWSYVGRPVRRWCDGFLIGRLVDVFISVSKADAKRMHEIEHVPEEKIVVVPTALTPRQVAFRRVRIRESLHLAPEAPIVLIAAKLRPEKAIDVLIEAFSNVNRIFPTAHLVVAGDGPERERLEALTRNLNLESVVHFLGYQEHISALVEQATICALVSDVEGLPLWALEVMQGSRPLIATGVGGIPEIVRDGLNGIIVPPQDTGAVAQAIIALLKDAPLRDALGAAAREDVVKSYSLNVITDQLEALYSY